MLEKRVLCPYPVKYLQEELDDITTGDFIMIAANTGTGKSTISRIFMDNAINHNCPVVLYSLEDQEGIPAANDCYMEYVKDGHRDMNFKQWLKDNTLYPDKYIKYRQRAMEKATKTNADGLKMRVVHEQSANKMWSFRDTIKQIRSEIEQGYKLFIIDHIDVLVPSERPEDMVLAIRYLWKIISENNVAIITFSQLASRRNLESLCPSLDDLRGSKAKVHTPTVVISISRHNYGYYNLPDPNWKPTYMRILKNRFGSTSCAVTYFYNGKYSDIYTKLDCNEQGTIIDSMTVRALSKYKKEQQ